MITILSVDQISRNLPQFMATLREVRRIAVPRLFPDPRLDDRIRWEIGVVMASTGLPLPMAGDMLERIYRAIYAAPAGFLRRSSLARIVLCGLNQGWTGEELRTVREQAPLIWKAYQALGHAGAGRGGVLNSAPRADVIAALGEPLARILDEHGVTT